MNPVDVLAWACQSLGNMTKKVSRAPTSALCLGRSEVLRSLRNKLACRCRAKDVTSLAAWRREL